MFSCTYVFWASVYVEGSRFECKTIIDTLLHTTVKMETLQTQWNSLKTFPYSLCEWPDCDQVSLLK